MSEKVCRRALKALMLLGLIGLGCKVFDSVALRGVDFTDNAVNAREQLGRGETNAFAVAAAALSARDAALTRQELAKASAKEAKAQAEAEQLPRQELAASCRGGDPAQR